MRSLFLTVALMVASLGAVAITPDKADARPPRYWSGYYSGSYYGSPGYWNGGSYWRGGTVWAPRYYAPRSYYYGSGYYYAPRGYYYGSNYSPRYYWP